MIPLTHHWHCRGSHPWGEAEVRVIDAVLLLLRLVRHIHLGSVVHLKCNSETTLKTYATWRPALSWFHFIKWRHLPRYTSSVVWIARIRSCSAAWKPKYRCTQTRSCLCPTHLSSWACMEPLFSLSKPCLMKRQIFSTENSGLECQ